MKKIIKTSGFIILLAMNVLFVTSLSGCREDTEGEPYFEGETDCNDGRDNDGDGAVDCGDYDCYELC